MTQGLPGPKSGVRNGASLYCREKKRCTPTRLKENRYTVSLVIDVDTSQTLWRTLTRAGHNLPEPNDSDDQEELEDEYVEAGKQAQKFNISGINIAEVTETTCVWYVHE
ncbi:hypothetical protein NDU88_004038 [Pleurodeles waltl]|uniref:Uncharacterized protein n=1 Tax=Pleurodeles waltl TaxID=8319 RepID=A0AAV7TRE5_PLEWA|nr:hypothetical protein NDU88_004038 [Pleurodeles waltl]